MTLPNTIVFFDVCNTLYDENTTFGFLRAFCRRRPFRRFLLQAVTAKSSPVFLGLALIHRATQIDLTRTLSLRLLQGESKRAIQDEAKCYAESLDLKKIGVMHAKLQEHVRQGHRVILLSGSIDAIVAPLASALGVEWYSSTLDYTDQVCAGRLSVDLTHGKLSIAKSLRASSSRAYIVVYTDNRSDKPLVDEADDATVIAYSESDAQFWSGTAADVMKHFP